MDGVVINARASADKIRAAGDVDEFAGVTALEGALARGPLWHERPGPARLHGVVARAPSLGEGARRAAAVSSGISAAIVDWKPGGTEER